MGRDYRSLSRPKSFGDRLLEAGLITRTQLDAALDQQETSTERRQRLGRILVELGFLTEADLIQMLSVHLGLPVARFPLLEADARALQCIPAGVARRHRALPCRIVDGVLLVAVADALAPAVIQELQVLSGLPTLTYVASEVDVEAGLLKHYGPQSTYMSRLRNLVDTLNELADHREQLARLVAEAERETRDLEDDDRLRRALEQLCRDSDAVVRVLTVITTGPHESSPAPLRLAELPGRRDFRDGVKDRDGHVT